jgi:hypothetical protein
MAKRAVPVTERALIQRLNRKLQREDQELKTARGAHMQQDAGRFYVINRKHGRVEAKHIDLEAMARKCGALQPWERLAD